MLRMIFDLPPEIQMAIKLRAIKNDVTTGAIVAEAIIATFGSDFEEAKQVLADTEK